MIKNLNEIDYSRIVGLLNERNRPSGGIRTVQEVAIQARINKDSKVLEIGSNTGFTAVNLALLTQCSVLGIDINLESIALSKKYAKDQGVSGKTRFFHESGLNLSMKKEEFDLVWASNVTSFIAEKKAAVAEYYRVLKYFGYLAVIPIYYIKEVPASLIKNVSEAIGVNINKWDKSYWINLIDEFSNSNSGGELELIYESDFAYDDKSSMVDAYVEEIVKGVSSEHPREELLLLKNRYQYFISLFNENLKYCGFSILLYQKRKIKDQPELFKGYKL